MRKNQELFYRYGRLYNRIMNMRFFFFTLFAFLTAIAIFQYRSESFWNIVFFAMESRMQMSAWAFFVAFIVAYHSTKNYLNYNNYLVIYIRFLNFNLTIFFVVHARVGSNA